MISPLPYYLNAAENIAFNIVGGLLTIPITFLAARLWLKWERRRFKRIFGDAETYSLIYGNLLLHPVVVNAIPNQQLRRFPLTKATNPNLLVSAENVASACEIRAASYVASALGKDGRVSSVFKSDDVLASKLDLDFISFGAMNNDKTLDAFANEGNLLAEYGVNERFFVSKRTRKPLCKERPGYDYGMILKVSPRQFPEKLWFCCAGKGEWGTSGAAWFLANKWRSIEKRIGTGKEFACVIEVKPGQDESATLVAFYGTAEEIG